MPKKQNEGEGGTEDKKTLSTLGNALAIALIAAYLVLVFIQWTHAGEAELTWVRRSDLLGGIEALAFAAAGAVLGTTVQRKATAKADQRTEDAKAAAERERQRAAVKELAAERGNAVVNLLEEKAAGDMRRGGEANSDLQELVGFARRYEE